MSHDSNGRVGMDNSSYAILLVRTIATVHMCFVPHRDIICIYIRCARCALRAHVKIPRHDFTISVDVRDHLHGHTCRVTTPLPLLVAYTHRGY